MLKKIIVIPAEAGIIRIRNKNRMKNLKKLFKEYGEKNPLEVKISERFLEFLEKNGERGFFRECLEGHFTGSMIVFNKDLTKTLLMHHKKLDKWVNFGGHADGENDIKNVAVRELEEEAGIRISNDDLESFLDLEIFIVPERKTVPEHFHYDIRYVVKVDEDIDFKKQESEVNDIKWFSLKEMENKGMEPGVIKVWKKLKK